MAEPNGPAPSQDCGRFHGRALPARFGSDFSSKEQAVIMAAASRSRLIFRSFVNDIITRLNAHSAR